MGFLAHAQTVSTRPLFPPTTWPGYEAMHIAHFLAKSFLASKIPGSCKFQSDLLATNGGIDMFAIR